jgi:hypothetical protein
MPDEEPKKDSSLLSKFISIGKDLVSLLRDTALFLLAVLLVLFPATFNSILVQAGFKEGSLAGFKWEANLVKSDSALKEANTTILDLQKKNDEMAKALAEASTKLSDPTFTQRITKLDQENTQLKEAAQQVQTSVSQTILSNAPLVEKALSSPSQSTLPQRQLSGYLVGVQTLGMSDEDREQLNMKLRKAGYSLHELSMSYPLGQRPSWFAQRSTVFYYARSALSAAQELARLLKSLTGQDFAVQRGAGAGVDPSQQEVTFFVHYLKS